MTDENAAARFQGELEERTRRALGILQEQSLQTLIVYSDAGNAGNVRYLTNYQPLFGPAILILQEDGERALIITFNWDAPRAHIASGIERIYPGPDTPGLLRRAMADLGITGTGAIALVGSSLIPHVVHAVLTEEGGQEPVELDGEFERLRLIKSRLEQDMLRRAAAATDQALEATLSEARAGMTELELAALMEYHMKRAGADGLSFPASIASGPNTEKPVSLPSHRALERGDLVMIDVGASWEGYCADVTRTVVVGAPSDRQQEIHGITAQALAASTQAVRPGVPANDLHRAAVEVLSQHDLDRCFTHRVGHGIGLETSLEPPDLQRDTQPLQPGMTFCIEPGVYIPGFGGVKIEDDIIVGTDGPEVISHTSRDLLVI